MKKKRDAMRQKMLMFKRQFGAKKTSGIGVIKDEIESLVRRNAAELVEDFQSVVQTSKDELGTELFALVQVAYAQRRRVRLSLRVVLARVCYWAHLTVACAMILLAFTSSWRSKPIMIILLMVAALCTV